MLALLGGSRSWDDIDRVPVGVDPDDISERERPNPRFHLFQVADHDPDHLGRPDELPACRGERLTETTGTE